MLILNVNIREMNAKDERQVNAGLEKTVRLGHNKGAAALKEDRMTQ
jgi:hypothetical protein